MFGFKKKEEKVKPNYSGYRIWDDKNNCYEYKTYLNNVRTDRTVGGPEDGKDGFNDSWSLPNPPTWGGKEEEARAVEQRDVLAADWKSYVESPSDYRRKKRWKKIGTIGGSAIGGFLLCILIGGIGSAIENRCSTETSDDVSSIDGDDSLV